MAGASADVDAGKRARPQDAQSALFTRPFLALCVVGFLGFASQFLIQPVLPLLIVSRGGDATLVGLIIAAFSLPSVVFRPWMGRLVDEWSIRGVLSGGLITVAISSVAYLIPTFIALFVVRVVHGTAWAAFNSGGHSLVGRLAPASRRGEASGIYNLMPAVSQMTMPAIGLTLLTAFGFDMPFLVAGALAAIAILVVPVIVGHLSTDNPRPSEPKARSLLERGAMLPMVIEVLFSSTWSLFLIYPPLFAQDRGLPVEQLTLYYPAVGITLVIARAALAKLSDRVGRGPVLIGGTGAVIVSLAVAAVANDVVVLAVAGMLWALAASVTSPTAMALAMDRAQPGRMGATMATYSLGFQLGLGGGAALFGAAIARIGFSDTFLVAIAVEVVLVLLLLYTWQALGRDHGARGAAAT